MSKRKRRSAVSAPDAFDEIDFEARSLVRGSFEETKQFEKQVRETKVVLKKQRAEIKKTLQAGTTKKKK